MPSNTFLAPEAISAWRIPVVSDVLPAPALSSTSAMITGVLVAAWLEIARDTASSGANKWD